MRTLRLRATTLTRTTCLALVLSISVSLGACTTANLEELRRVDPKGTPLQNALAERYLAFAESEAAQYDWVDSNYFAQKGLSAAYGKETTPEDLSQWRIPPEYADEMRQGRERLAAVLANPGSASVEALADGQFYFDCWVEQQEENWEESEIAECRDNFQRAMADLKTAGAGMAAAESAAIGEVSQATIPAAKPAEPVDVKEIAIKEAPKTAQGHHATPKAPRPLIVSKAAPDENLNIAFEPASALLTADAKSAIERIAKQAKEKGAATLTLQGHADQKGNPQYNLALSQKRAMAVREALIAQGVDSNRIEVFAFGDTEGEAADTKEKARQVEVLFKSPRA